MTHWMDAGREANRRAQQRIASPCPNARMGRPRCRDSALPQVYWCDSCKPGRGIPTDEVTLETELDSIARGDSDDYHTRGLLSAREHAQKKKQLHRSIRGFGVSKVHQEETDVPPPFETESTSNDIEEY